MLIKQVVVEVRRNLCCANIFLEFYELRSTTKDDNGTFKILLEDNDLRIQDGNESITVFVNEDFTIEKSSVSNLLVEEKNASFRVSLRPTLHTLNSYRDVETLDTLSRPKLTLDIKVEEPVKILCRCCHVDLFKGETAFKRILEFPSGSIDVSEFFCHNGPNFKNSLTPKSTDAFYGFYFVVINSSNLVNVKTKEDHVYCRRCLSYIGQQLFDGATKLWSDSVDLNRTGSTTSTSLFATPGMQSIILDLLQKVLSECGVNKEVHCIQFAKVVLEAYYPDRTKRYLLLNILERNLQILRGCTTVDEIKPERLQLKKCRGFKILFRIEEDESNPMLIFWKADFNVHTMAVSHQLLSALGTHLIEQSRVLPEAYQHSNGFMLSYVFY